MKVSELKSRLAAIDDDYEIEIWIKEDEDREMLCEIDDVSTARHRYVSPRTVTVDVVEINIRPSYANGNGLLGQCQITK